MKWHRIIVFSISILGSMFATAQDISTYIEDSRSAFIDDNLIETRLNLQKALIELDKAISRDILNILPKELNSLSANSEKDDVGASAGMAGLFLGRTYGNEQDKYAELTIADNSPMMSVISQFMNNPLLAGIAASSGGQKMIKINGYKAMLQQEEDSDVFTIMVPFGDTLITLESNNGNESDIISMMEKIPLAEIEDIVD